MQNPLESKASEIRASPQIIRIVLQHRRENPNRTPSEIYRDLRAKGYDIEREQVYDALTALITRH